MCIEFLTCLWIRPLFGHFRAFLDCSWALLGTFGALLGRSWATLGPFSVAQGPRLADLALGELSGRSWAALETLTTLGRSLAALAPLLSRSRAALGLLLMCSWVLLSCTLGILGRSGRPINVSVPPCVNVYAFFLSSYFWLLLGRSWPFCGLSSPQGRSWALPVRSQGGGPGCKRHKVGVAKKVSRTIARLYVCI